MNKTVIGLIVVIALAGAAYFGASLLAGGSSDVPGSASSEPAGGTGQSGDPNQPERTAEVKGAVISVDGTTVVIDRLLIEPSQELTEEEKAAKKAERQGMSMEERQAAKAAEQAGLASERVNVEIPVGVTMTRMIPGDDGPTVQPATLADVKVGVTLSVWTDGPADGGVAEYVKIQASN
ncbi:MAG: hypothetical protein U1E26_00845 [Coriobacteriia bacterium]|nr:hypothetical protein [Coriobacteriia bacterium]